MGTTLAAAGPPFALLFDFSVILYLFPILLWCAAAGWVLWDSVQRSGEWGWIWGLCAFGAAPIVVPLYIFCVFMATRPAPAWVQREKELESGEVKRYKSMGELERVKFLEAAAGSGGTLYSPVAGMQPHGRGVKQFSDAHAEQLLSQQQYKAAFLYLYDMYMLAVGESDKRGEETYRHYITQLPEGQAWLKRARDKQLSPAQLKVGGIDLLDSWTQPPDRSRPAAQQHEPEAETLPQGTQTLEQLLTEREVAPPTGAGQRPGGVKPARDPRAVKRPEVPF